MLDREKREWKRIAVDLVARCRAVDGPARYDDMRIVDMHHQGCCLEGHVPFNKGDQVRIIVQIPFEGQISLTGEVVWSGIVDKNDGSRTGVRFLVDSVLVEEAVLKLYHYCLLCQPKD